MAKSKVYFTTMRTVGDENLCDKLVRLCRAARDFAPGGLTDFARGATIEMENAAGWARPRRPAFARAV